MQARHKRLIDRKDGSSVNRSIDGKLILSTLNNQPLSRSPFGPDGPIFLSQAARAATEIRRRIENDEVDEEDGPYGSDGHGADEHGSPSRHGSPGHASGPTGRYFRRQLLRRLPRLLDFANLRDLAALARRAKASSSHEKARVL